MRVYHIIFSVVIILLCSEPVVCRGQQSADHSNPFAPLNKEAEFKHIQATQIAEKGMTQGGNVVREPIVWNWNEQKELLSLSVDNVAIREVLQFLAKHSGLNIVVAQEVEGVVSLHLKDVTWQTALEAAVQAGGGVLKTEGDTLMVSDAKSVRETAVFYLNHANAKELEEVVKQLVSATGKVGADQRLNSLVVSDIASNLEPIRLAIEKLDIMAEQIMIEVLIVNVKLTDELKMGIDWTQLGTSEVFYNQALSATGGINPSGELNVSVTTGNWNIMGLMDFVETHDNVSILANPKILVLNNHPATIDSVEEIPYLERTSTAEGGDFVSTSFREAGIKLQVTPQITNDGHIIIHVAPEQSAQIGTFTVAGNDTPVIETRKTNTTMQVKDGQTIVIAGLRQKQPSKKVNKVPILGDIPLLGLLFQRVETEEMESELAVFITPHICSDEKLREETGKLLGNINTGKSLLETRNVLEINTDD